MPGEWISAAAVVAAAQIFYGSLDAAVRALVVRAAAGLLRTRARHLWFFDADMSRSPAAGGATVGNVGIPAGLWLDLYDCLFCGAGPADTDWARGNVTVDCGVVRDNRAIVAGCRWFGLGISFWGPDLPFRLDGTPVETAAFGTSPPRPERHRAWRTTATASAKRLRQRLRRTVPLRRRAFAARRIRRAGPRVGAATPAGRGTRVQPKARPPPTGHGRGAVL
jgi:hypothetical protein